MGNKGELPLYVCRFEVCEIALKGVYYLLFIWLCVFLSAAKEYVVGTFIDLLTEFCAFWAY